ncbi:hypothetical protein EV421DRAFT_1916387 [Armillaria borealis]|uniref:Uncharacterized protein n=1 Tax=Armillaria borealis TaxID=47425 RepID=A0AA39IE58_9AGAR|nr:hypothetical protein EV421DRAFT_1916387 [Armillaria borealis]
MPVSQEVIDMIVTLACKRDLKTSLRCALVSRAFVPAARKETFYRLFIHDYTFGQPPSRSTWHTLLATLKFFRDNPHISSCPRVLCYRAHPHVSVARLKRLLSQLTSVHTLIIERSDTDVCTLPNLSPFLRNIYFRDCYISHGGMSRLLTSSQNVEKLCIVGNWVTSSTILNRAYRLPVPPVPLRWCTEYGFWHSICWIDHATSWTYYVPGWLPSQKLIVANSRSLLKLRVAVMKAQGWSAVIRPLRVYRSANPQPGRLRYPSRCSSSHTRDVDQKLCFIASVVDIGEDEATKKFDALDRVLHDIGSKADACTITIHLVFDSNLVWEQNWCKDGKEYTAWIYPIAPAIPTNLANKREARPLFSWWSSTETVLQGDFDDAYTCNYHWTTTSMYPDVEWPADPESYIGCHWASNSMPYGGFLPVRRADIFECELFQCLNHTSTSLPVHSSGRGLWSLGAKVVESWRNLEALLARLRQVLEVQAGHRNIDHLHFPFPWKYGYHHAKPSRKAMVYSAVRSRDAFILMAAEISYFLALVSDSFEGSLFQNWSAILTREVGGKWGKNLPADAVGIFIDPRECNFGYFLRAYTNFKVPFWIDWGLLDQPYKAESPEQMHDYYFRLPPSRTVTRTAASTASPSITRDLAKGEWRKRPPGWGMTIGWSHNDAANLPPKVSVQDDAKSPTESFIPQPAAERIQLEPRVADSRSNMATHQRLGETWQDFFRRREDKAAKIIQSESVRERQSRKARELDAMKQRCPARSANVFIWDVVEGKDYLVRQHVPHRDVPDIWDDYAPSQQAIFLDAVQSERELFYEDEDCDDQPSSFVGSAPVEPTIDLFTKRTAREWEVAHAKMYGTLVNDLKPKETLSWTLEAVLRYRYGVVIPPARTQPTPVSSLDKVKQEKCRKGLGSFNAPRDRDAAASDADLILLLSGLQWLVEQTHRENLVTPGIPEAWWDLTSKHASLLGKKHIVFGGPGRRIT